MPDVQLRTVPGAWSLTVSEVAEMVGVRAQTIRRWADKGHVPCWRSPYGVRRFRREDIAALIAAGQN